MDRDFSSRYLFDGSNYGLWSIHFTSFLEGRGLWGIVDGTDPLPKPDKPTELAEWKIKNGKIVTWILDSVEKSIAVGLTPHKTAQAMWDHLKVIYQQSNEARLYRLEQELTQLSQGDRTVQAFYNDIVAIWTEISMMDPEFPSDAIPIFQKMRERTRVRQFLMKLRPDFEHCRAALLNHSPLPSMNVVICDLLAEEQRLKALTCASRSPGSLDTVLLASSPTPGKRDMSRVQYYGCKKFGHLATACKESPICAFCKICGHSLQECRKKKRGQGKVYMTTTDDSSTSVMAPPLPSGPLTPEMVQQIVQALSAAGLSGNQIISTADGAHLPISSVGSLSFFPSQHRTFTLIDDLATGKVVGKGRRKGRLFLLDLDDSSVRCMYLGFGDSQKGYRCYDPHARRIRISRNVVFLENVSFHAQPSPPLLAPSIAPSGLTWFPDIPPVSSVTPAPLQIPPCQERAVPSPPIPPAAATVANPSIPEVVVGAGFSQSGYDPSLFIRSSSHGIVVLLVYVDDILLTGSDTSGIVELQQVLQSSFHMKDLGSLTYFLGLEVSRTDRGILVSQRKYTCDLINQAQLSDQRTVETPMELNVQYGKQDVTRLELINVLEDDISSSNYAQFLEFYDHGLFPENLQHSEVSSCSNCCYEEKSYTTNLSFSSISSFPSDVGSFNNNNNNNANTNTNIATTTTTTNNLSTILDSQDENNNDISTSIDFSPSPTFSIPPFLATPQDQCDFSSLQLQIPLTDVGNGFSSYSLEAVVPLGGPPLPSVFEDDCLPPMPSYVCMNPSSPSCSFLDPTIGPPYLSGTLNMALSTETSRIFAGNSLLSSELQPHELEFQGDNGGIYGSEWTQRVYCAGDIQYACRKTLADSRPRVRGRFAKNDEFGENPRPYCSNHEDEDDEDIAMKEGEDMVDSSDIFAHISGVNSFKCNHPIPSWI
ncbi:hypothetical protein HHK36_012928 [Tetracentron sinense]|uniref:CCT domain-containing protein n=1 Tax=Tetracentron sinense TaxID=13715 RepID=A0A834ZG67_TETSI|nr:hypothetical protein HHK36_012928 [Tetracentron sinense]